MQVRRILLLSFVLLVGLPVRAFEPAQATAPALSDKEKAEHQRLSGKWLVVGAKYQTNGRKTYTFDNGTLWIVNRWSEIAKDGSIVPFSESITQYRYTLNIDRDPKQIALAPINDTGGKERKIIYEFRDGKLRFSTDDGPTPKSRVYTPNDVFGDEWWEEQLERVK